MWPIACYKLALLSCNRKNTNAKGVESKEMSTKMNKMIIKDSKFHQNDKFDFLKPLSQNQFDEL